MKLFKDIDARKHFVQFIDGEDGVISLSSDDSWPLIPFQEKAVVPFDDTLFYIYAERQHCFDKSVAIKDKNINLLINLWLKFSDQHTSEYVLRVEKFLDEEIQKLDKNCHSRALGRNLILNGMWEESRFNLLFRFEVEDFPIRKGLLESIKSVLRQAQGIYNFIYPVSKDEIIETYIPKKRVPISDYVHYFKTKYNMI